LTERETSLLELRDVEEGERAKLKEGGSRVDWGLGDMSLNMCLVEGVKDWFE